MKIFAVIRNYGATEGNSPFGTGAMTWYEIPDSSLLRTGQPFFVPDFAGEFRAFPTVMYRVSRLGKGIPARFAGRYFDSAAMGCSAVAVDLLERLRNEGEPWCRAVAFDKCCMLGKFQPMDGFPEEWKVRCGDTVMTYDLNEIRQSIGEVLELLSRDITVKEGDMVLAALHPDGLPLRVGTNLAVCPADCDFEKDAKVLDINIR